MKLLVLAHRYSLALTWARDVGLQMSEWGFVTDRYSIMGIERGTTVVKVPGYELRRDLHDIEHEILIRQFNVVEAGSWRR